MPEMIQGWKDGESKWFKGRSLPEGWDLEPNGSDPVIIPDAPQEEADIMVGKPKKKSK